MADKNMASMQAQLIRAIADTLVEGARRPLIFETHISWIVVVTNYAYKFKKAVRFDFLDFSSLQARHFYCQEELRLNRRLAPELYLDVVAITGKPSRPQIGGAGMPLEYAVKMRAFSQQALWSARIEQGCLSSAEIDELAHILAHFHQDAAVASQQDRWGAPDALQDTAEDNLRVIGALIGDAEAQRVVHEFRAWQAAQHAVLRTAFDARKTQGFVRECHGDLHSANILTIDGRVAVFDCIEFNERFRWIDVMNDLAFICMDLQCHGLQTFAARLLNAYLENTGDYKGLAVLRYYQIQRALVRCKVALLRAQQVKNSASKDEKAASQSASLAADYLAYARQNIRPAQAGVILMHGYSGCGKSTLAACLLELIGAVRIRSDVERKRMHGVAPRFGAPSGIGSGLYQQEATQATYEHLQMLAGAIVAAGFPVIVDATFLKKTQRHNFQKIAHDLAVPFFIIDIQVDAPILQQRIVARAQLGQDPSDASLAVLARQLQESEALSEAESKDVIVFDGLQAMVPALLRHTCAPIIRALRPDLD